MIATAQSKAESGCSPLTAKKEGDGGWSPHHGFLNALNSFSLSAHFGFGHSNPDLTHRQVEGKQVLSWSCSANPPEQVSTEDVSAPAYRPTHLQDLPKNVQICGGRRYQCHEGTHHGSPAAPADRILEHNTAQPVRAHRQEAGI